MKKNGTIIIILLLLAISIVGYTYWVNRVESQNISVNDDVGVVGDWREKRMLTLIDSKTGNILEQKQLYWQEKLPHLYRHGYRIWYTNSQLSQFLDYETMPNYDVVAYGRKMNISSTTLGGAHGVITDRNGNIWTWGMNDKNQTGHFGEGDIARPKMLEVNDTKFTMTSGSIYSSVALDEDGNIWTWGSNDFGQTGQGTSVGITEVPTMINSFIQYIKVMGSGTNFLRNPNKFAIDSQRGRLWSWGSDQGGKMGTLGSSTRPVFIGLGGVSFLDASAGSEHSLAVDNQGNLWSWGTNTNGALGLGEQISFEMEPKRIETGDLRFKAVSARSDHSLALDREGNLWSWGLNTFSQTGLNIDDEKIYIPTKVDTGDVRFVDIASGNTHSLAIDEEGQIWSWGNNENGRTGHNIIPGVTAAPRKINTGTTRFIYVCAGSNMSMAIDTTGRLWTWGGGSYYRTGLSTTANRLVPTMNPINIPL